MLSITNTFLNVFKKPELASFVKENITSKYERPVHAFFHRRVEHVIPNVTEFNDKLFSLVCDKWEKRDLTKDEMLLIGYRGYSLSTGVVLYVGNMKE